MSRYTYINPETMAKIVEDVRKAHYQMLLVVEPPNQPDDEKIKSTKEEIKRWVIDNNGESIDLEELAISLSEDINREMLGEILIERIREYFHKKSVELTGPAYVENADILFSPEFGAIDVIHLLKYSSREIPIVTSMSLEFNEVRERVTYGKPEDDDYHPDLDVSEIVVMRLEEVML